MLILGSRLSNTPIMGLQTGSKLATTAEPVIDPSNLQIIAYRVESQLLSHNPAFLRIADVRELSSIGMIIDSNDEFVGLDDVIIVKRIYNLDFKLIGLNVIDENKHKLGKVEDYTVDTDSFVIQSLNVKCGLIRSLTESGLLIHRSQIIEINDYNIIVNSTSKKVKLEIKTDKLTYMNPFRSSNPQTNTSEI